MTAPRSRDFHCPCPIRACPWRWRRRSKCAAATPCSAESFSMPVTPRKQWDDRRASYMQCEACGLKVRGEIAICEAGTDCGGHRCRVDADFPRKPVEPNGDARRIRDSVEGVSRSPDFDLCVRADDRLRILCGDPQNAAIAATFYRCCKRLPEALRQSWAKADWHPGIVRFLPSSFRRCLL